MAKLRGTEAEIYARLRELAHEFRQVRRELADSTRRRVSVNAEETGRAGEPQRPSRQPRPKRRGE